MINENTFNYDYINHHNGNIINNNSNNNKIQSKISLTDIPEWNEQYNMNNNNKNTINKNIGIKINDKNDINNNITAMQ